MNSFQDAVIVVTGAGCGIGRATALTFSRLGAKLVLADIQEEPLAKVAGEISSNGGNVRAFHLDVSDREQMESFARAVLDEFRNVDVVISNAGVLILGETRLVSLEDFRWLMGVNFWKGNRAILSISPRPMLWPRCRMSDRTRLPNRPWS